jgi:hypothetical protein
MSQKCIFSKTAFTRATNFSIFITEALLSLAPWAEIRSILLVIVPPNEPTVLSITCRDIGVSFAVGNYLLLLLLFQ